MSEPRDTSDLRLRTILVGTDLSDQARSALEAAVRLRPPKGARIHAVHAVPNPDPAVIIEGGSRARPEETASEDRFDRSHYRALVKQHSSSAGIPPEEARIHVRKGRPHRVLAGVAREVGASLVVLGKHRPRRAFDGLLGSTGERLVRTARLPCLLVNSEVLRMPQRLMVASDLSPPAERALRVAITWARQWAEARDPESGANDRVAVEVVTIADYARAGYTPFDRTKELARLAARASEEAGPAVEVGSRIASYPLAAEGIFEVARESRPDLVFLGTHGHGPVARALFGSVTSEVIRTLPLAVVVVPPPAEHRAPK